MPIRPAVYFFDEFDAIGRTRGDPSDVGELRRVVITFLQLMDADQSPGLIIAATNFDSALDTAIFRRFDQILQFPLPTAENLADLVRMRLARFDLADSILNEIAKSAVGHSFADVARMCDEAMKSMVLEGRRAMLPEDLELASTDLRLRQSLD